MWFFTKDEVKPSIEIRLPEPNPEHVRITRAADLLSQRRIINYNLAKDSNGRSYGLSVWESPISGYYPSVHLSYEQYTHLLMICRDDIDAELTDLGVPLS